MDYNEIGKRIMLARKEAGLLQRHLAEKLELDQATISCYENGVLAIEMETITKISQILGKPIAYFYGDEYSKVPQTVSLDEVSIPIFTEIPDDFPTYLPGDVKGYQKHPKHLYPGAEFVLKKPLNLAQEPDDSGDYYYLRIEREPLNGSAMLYKMDSKFYIQRVTVRKNTLEIHSIKHKQHLKSPKDVNFIAVLLDVSTEIR